MTLKDEGRSGTLDGYYWVRDERSAIGTEQEQGIRSRLPALVRQQQTEQMSDAALLRGGRAAGRRSVPNGDSRRVGASATPPEDQVSATRPLNPSPGIDDEGVVASRAVLARPL